MLTRSKGSLDLTYDLHNMTGGEVLSLLPSEFDEWRPKERVKTLLLNFIKKGETRRTKSNGSQR